MDGKALSSYCAQAGKPSRSAVYKWKNQFAEFSEQITRARLLGIETLLDKVVKIINAPPPMIEGGKEIRVDMAAVQLMKVKGELTFKMAALLAPDKYGAKVGLGIEGALTVNINTGVPTNQQETITEITAETSEKT